MKKKVTVVGILVLLLVLGTAVVYALQITMDGQGGDWLPAALVYTDCDENGSNSVDCDPTDNISAYHDIGNIYATNSVDDFFLRFDTYDNVRWNNVSGLDPRLVVCWDVDNDTGTGVTVANCGDQQGVDRQVQVISFNGLLLSDYQVCDNSSCVTDGTADFEIIYDTITPRSITEIRVDVTDLGVDNSVSPTVCPNGNTSQPCIMQVAIFFDNGTSEDDDNVPFSGTLSIPLGDNSPTAVSLQSTSASTSSSTLLGLAVAFALTLVSAGALIYRRQTRAQ